ncbi:ral guanine nucleotide dissociation stimulator isoform X1 [Oryctolagus cuniculus]|uniref:ral guanine nucleotide dissociation stimulator isoform X1 n=1 Tax=Oryctolagus cuniculus TaxID=9986 RepID=UPI0038791F67
MFSCCVLTSQGHGPRKPWGEGFQQRIRRWFSRHSQYLWPFGRKHSQSCSYRKGQVLLNKVLYSISFMERQAANRGCCWLMVKIWSNLIVYDAHVGWRIQGRTLLKLIDSLVPAFLGWEPAYVPNFLRTYRAFATTQQVLDTLFARYPWFAPTTDCVLQDTVKYALSSILATWLEQYPEDFNHPPHYTSLYMLLDYTQLNLCGFELDQQVQLLLRHLQQQEPAEAELEGEEDRDWCIATRACATSTSIARWSSTAGTGSQTTSGNLQGARASFHYGTSSRVLGSANRSTCRASRSRSRSRVTCSLNHSLFYWKLKGRKRLLPHPKSLISL